MKVQIFSSFFIWAFPIKTIGLQPPVFLGRAVRCNLASCLVKDFHCHR